MKTETPVAARKIKMPKNYEKFQTLLPSHGFCILKPENFKEMMKIIRNEQDKNLKHIYFTQVLDRLFTSRWGWYMRLGESLSEISRYEYAGQLPEKTRADGLKVLRMVKEMHIELRYSPSYISVINHHIKAFGGKLMSEAEKAMHKDEKFKRARAALITGEKLPRKLKKETLARMERMQQRTK